MSWQIVLVDQLKDVHALRRAIFIVEQGISEAEEWDDKDDSAQHLLATVDGVPAGTARLLVEGDIGRIGRICVTKPQRGTGLGAALVTESIARLSTHAGIRTIRLGAQTYATGFYRKLGFSVCGPEYDDAGIPHHEMELPL